MVKAGRLGEHLADDMTTEEQKYKPVFKKNKFPRELEISLKMNGLVSAQCFNISNCMPTCWSQRLSKLIICRCCGFSLFLFKQEANKIRNCSFNFGKIIKGSNSDIKCCNRHSIYFQNMNSELEYSHFHKQVNRKWCQGSLHESCQTRTQIPLTVFWIIHMKETFSFNIDIDDLMWGYMFLKSIMSARLYIAYYCWPLKILCILINHSTEL